MLLRLNPTHSIFNIETFMLSELKKRNTSFIYLFVFVYSFIHSFTPSFERQRNKEKATDKDQKRILSMDSLPK